MSPFWDSLFQLIGFSNKYKEEQPIKLKQRKLSTVQMTSRNPISMRPSSTCQKLNQIEKQPPNLQEQQKQQNIYFTRDQVKYKKHVTKKVQKLYLNRSKESKKLYVLLRFQNSGRDRALTKQSTQRVLSILQYDQLNQQQFPQGPLSQIETIKIFWKLIQKKSNSQFRAAQQRILKKQEPVQKKRLKFTNKLIEIKQEYKNQIKQNKPQDIFQSVASKNKIQDLETSQSKDQESQIKIQRTKSQIVIAQDKKKQSQFVTQNPFLIKSAAVIPQLSSLISSPQPMQYITPNNNLNKQQQRVQEISPVPFSVLPNYSSPAVNHIQLPAIFNQGHFGDSTATQLFLNNPQPQSLGLIQQAGTDQKRDKNVQGFMKKLNKKA